MLLPHLHVLSANPELPAAPHPFLGITVAQIILGVIAAVLVAVQKFFFICREGVLEAGSQGTVPAKNNSPELPHG